MSDTNVGLGMVLHKADCSCHECEIERLQAEVERLRADQTLFATGDRAILEQNQKLKAEVERLRLSQMSAFYEGWDARSRARTFEVDTAWEYSSTKELLDEHGNR